MNVDALGFLRKTEMDFALMHVNNRINQKLQAGTVMDSKVEIRSCSNCWI